MPTEQAASREPSDLRSIKALTFDVGGTVFDWHHTILAEVGRLVGEEASRAFAAAFANDWRRAMFGILAQVRAGSRPWMNADAMHRLALDDVLPRYPALQLDAGEREDLTRVWHRLQVWPDATAAIEQLRRRFTVVVLTVLSWSIVVDSSKVAGLQWDGILSCEFLGAYKPDREAYLAGTRLLGTAPGETMMVAAHPSDLETAVAAGLCSAYVARPHERGVDAGGDVLGSERFDVHARDYPDLVRQILERA